MNEDTAQRFHVVPADYTTDFQALRLVRETVFVAEQQVPLEEEWDALDPVCDHVLAVDLEGRPIGTGRLAPDGRIGRMAVLAPWRGKGVGVELLARLLERAAALGRDEVSLHAQSDAEAFYRRAGFIAEGEEFVEAGIRHRRMRMSLTHRPAGEVVHGARPDAASRPVEEFESFEDAVRATIAVIEAAPRGLAAYSRDGDSGVLGDPRVAEALRGVLTRNRDARLRLIIQEPQTVTAAHPLIALAQRLSSRIELRTPVDPVDRSYAAAWLAADRGGFVHRPLATRAAGEASAMAPARARQLIAAFDPVWERSRVLSEFRVLGI